LTEALTVTAETPVVGTSGIHASSTINRIAIATLPLNGRDFRDFALLTPRVQDVPGVPATLRIGGQMGESSLLTVDGADCSRSTRACTNGTSRTSASQISGAT
jgi:hypothetical protein